MSAHLANRVLPFALLATAGLLSGQTPLIHTAAGSGPGVGLASAQAFAFDSAGNIYVTDNLKARVFKIDTNERLPPSREQARNPAAEATSPRLPPLFGHPGA